MRIITIYLLTFLTFSTYCQTSNDTTWYTDEWKETRYDKVKSFYGIRDFDKKDRGLVTYYYKNGTLHSHQNELNELKDGICIWYHINGKKKNEASYANDTLQGEMKKYNEQEQLLSLSAYKMGQIVSRIEYNPGTGEVIALKKKTEDFPDKEAEFVGGNAALSLWIAKNVEYPKDAIEMNEQGKVYVSFVIEENGTISTIVVEKGVSASLDAEAIRLIESMPNWIPGELEGTKVRTRARLPINFTLDSGKKNKKDKRNR